MRIFTSFLLLSSTLHSETLTDALAGAYNGKAMQEARRNILANHEKTVQARAEFRPTISAKATANRSKDIYSGDSKESFNALYGSYGMSGASKKTNSATVQFQQNIFKGGSSLAGVSAIDNQIKGAWADLKGTEQKTLLETAKLVFDIIAKIEEIESYKSNIAFLTKQFESTHDKFKAGEETVTNVKSAEGELAGGLAQLQTAEAELEGLNAQYESTTGRKAAKFSKPNVPNFLPKTLEEALKYARENHPEIIKASFAVSSAKDEKDKNAGRLLPSVDLTASTERQEARSASRTIQPRTTIGNNYTTSNTVRVEMSVPLYEGGAIRSQIREAHEKSEAARVAVEKARVNVDAGVIAARQNFITAEANLKNYQHQVDAYALVVQSVEQEKEAGSKTLVDVLKAQKELVNAQRTFVNAEKSYYLSAYQYASAVGKLNAKELNLPVEIFNPEEHFENTKWQF